MPIQNLKTKSYYSSHVQYPEKILHTETNVCTTSLSLNFAISYNQFTEGRHKNIGKWLLSSFSFLFFLASKDKWQLQFIFIKKWEKPLKFAEQFNSMANDDQTEGKKDTKNNYFIFCKTLYTIKDANYLSDWGNHSKFSYEILQT